MAQPQHFQLSTLLPLRLAAQRQNAAVAATYPPCFHRSRCPWLAYLLPRCATESSHPASGYASRVSSHLATPHCVRLPFHSTIIGYVGLAIPIGPPPTTMELLAECIHLMPVHTNFW